MEYSLVKGSGNKFFSVTKEDIGELQRNLKCDIPVELYEFWEKVGYGFITGSEYNINRIMDPLSVLDFRLRKGDFQFLPDIEIYDEYEEGKLIFYEASESAYISIGISSSVTENKIFYYDVKIADSLYEFLQKIHDNDEYYLDMII